MDAATPAVSITGAPLFQVEPDPTNPGGALITVDYNAATGHQQYIKLRNRDLPSLVGALAAYLPQIGLSLES
jgi:hypothetical protein